MRPKNPVAVSHWTLNNNCQNAMKCHLGNCNRRYGLKNNVISNDGCILLVTPPSCFSRRIRTIEEPCFQSERVFFILSSGPKEQPLLSSGQGE